ncbi:RNAse H domain protein, YqgF family [Serratia marcescens]|uniref:RNAse H domain protein, YqgF family n=1 Tax=Serratia marcescens TaxID=615 RepID=A0A379YJU2_SERMA|nr:RNAse H domain protein, YqgF family [Serratia marcescens]
MGLVINKPVEQFTVATVLSKLKIMPPARDPAISLDKPVFAGGPLADDRGFILHTPRHGFGASIQISPNTMITTSKDVLETLGTPEQPDDVLVALGYAGWEKGQLEQEVLENAWLTIEANTDILFRTPIGQPLARGGEPFGYRHSQHRQPRRTRLMSNRTIIAFDFGTKSIGAAVGQELTGSARALPAFKAQDGSPDWLKIEKAAEGVATGFGGGRPAAEHGWHRTTRYRPGAQVRQPPARPFRHPDRSA